MFILDNRGRPLRLNGLAEGLIGRYFRITDSVVEPALEHERDDFRSAISTAAHLAHQISTTPPRPLTISSLEGGPPLAVWILPALGASAETLSFLIPTARVLLLAQFMSQGQVVDPAVIRSVFNLTFGEARLAALLATGMSIRAASKELNITEGTSRVVLKRVFRKLGVHRQAELVARLSALGR